MERHLELIVVGEIKDSTIYFKIKEQTHREDDFCYDGKTFEASNGYVLKSYYSPEYDGISGIIYVRGYFEDYDDKVLSCSKDEYIAICEAVDEYNETNGAGYGNEWPEENDTYYFITPHCSIVKTKFTGNALDEENKAKGNCFKTERQAKKILNLFKEFMKHKI